MLNTRHFKILMTKTRLRIHQIRGTLKLRRQKSQIRNTSNISNTFFSSSVTQRASGVFQSVLSIVSIPAGTPTVSSTSTGFSELVENQMQSRHLGTINHAYKHEIVNIFIYLQFHGFVCSNRSSLRFSAPNHEKQCATQFMIFVMVTPCMKEYIQNTKRHAQSSPEQHLPTFKKDLNDKFIKCCLIHNIQAISHMSQDNIIVYLCYKLLSSHFAYIML